MRATYVTYRSYSYDMWISLSLVFVRLQSTSPLFEQAE